MPYFKLAVLAYETYRALHDILILSPLLVSLSPLFYASLISSFSHSPLPHVVSHVTTFYYRQENEVIALFNAAVAAGDLATVPVPAPKSATKGSRVSDAKSCNAYIPLGVALDAIV